MPASTIKSFRSEAAFSYIQTSLFTWTPPASRMTSVAVHIPCMSVYQTFQSTIEKLNGPCPSVIFYLPVKSLCFSTNQKWWCSWDGENETKVCRLVWELSCAHQLLDYIDAFANHAANHLLRLAHPFKTFCLFPQRCTLLDLTGSHSMWTSISPHISATLPRPMFWILVFSETPHFLCPPTLCTFSFPTASPKLDPHLQQLQLPPGFLPPVKYIYELLSSSQLPHAHHLTALWVLAGFYKLCCYHLLVPWSAVCNAPPLLSQWLSPALRLAFCSGADSMIWPLMRLKTTWTQAAPAK